MKIKIPKGLPLAVCHNRRLQKTVAFFLVLKAQCDSGVIFKSNAELYAEQMKLTPRTIQSRFKDLVKFALAKESGKNVLTLISFDKLKDQLSLTDTRNYYVKFEHAPILHYKLAALAISDKKINCKTVFNGRAKAIELKPYLCSVLRVQNYELNEALKKCQLTLFALGSDGFTDEQTELINYLNPDFNFNYKTLSSMFGYNGIGSMAYLKRKLALLQLISVEKREYAIPTSIHKTKDSRNTILGNVFFSRKTNELILKMCDKIQVR